MKRILFVLSMLVSVFTYGQSKGYFRYDTTVFEKIGGNNELIIKNGSKSITGGVLTNMGNGRTAFVTPSAIPILDTIWHYILATGQSNSFGSADDAIDTAFYRNLQVWDTTARVWKTYIITGSPTAQFYFGRKWARELNAKADSNVVHMVRVVNVALGALSINSWHNGVTPQQMLNIIDSQSVRARVPKYDLMIWDQGESDNGMTPYDYTLRFDSVKSFMRRKVYFPQQTPIVVAGMPRIAQGAPPIGVVGIDPVLQSFAYNSDPWDGYATTDSATLNVPPGHLHFNSAGLKQLGEEAIWAAWENLPAIFKSLFSVFQKNTAEELNVYTALDSSINLGIGDTIPAYKLDVTGDVNVKATYGYRMDGYRVVWGSANFGNFYFGRSGNYSTAYSNAIGMGTDALLVNQASSNIAIGANALKANTTGSNNIAIGIESMLLNVTGNYNTAIGNPAMRNANSTGSGNVAIGYSSLNNTTGDNNTAVGYSSLVNNTSGAQNAAVGISAGANNTTGIYNSYFGPYAGLGITTGNFNTIIGGNWATASISNVSNYVRLSDGQNNPVLEGRPDSANIHHVFRRSSARDKMVMIDTITGLLTYKDAASGGSTPTLQDVLTAGSTLNTNNVIDVDGNNFSISFGSALTLNSDQIFINSDQTTELSGPRLSLGATDSIEFASPKYTYPTLSDQPTRITDTTGTSVQVFNRATGDWKSIPSGIYGAGGGSSGWGLTGNTVGANGNFIGTNDNFNFAIKTNGLTKALFGAGANTPITFGTSHPSTVSMINLKYDGSNSFGSRGFLMEDVYNGGSLCMQILSGKAYFTDAAGTATGINVAVIENPADGSKLENGSTYWKFTSTNLGIGTTPAVQFHTTGAVRFANFGAGTATFDGSGNISSSSDRRKKENIRPFKSGLDVIRKINPQYFTWNKMSGLNMNDKNIGFIAQDILPLIPEAVGKDSKGYLSLNDRPILAANVNATKELYDMILALQKEVAELKAIIKAKK